jgi:hypothetical protein
VHAFHRRPDGKFDLEQWNRVRSNTRTLISTNKARMKPRNRLLHDPPWETGDNCPNNGRILPSGGGRLGLFCGHLLARWVFGATIPASSRASPVSTAAAFSVGSWTRSRSSTACYPWRKSRRRRARRFRSWSTDRGSRSWLAPDAMAGHRGDTAAFGNTIIHGRTPTTPDDACDCGERFRLVAGMGLGRISG